MAASGATTTTRAACVGLFSRGGVASLRHWHTLITLSSPIKPIKPTFLRVAVRRHASVRSEAPRQEGSLRTVGPHKVVFLGTPDVAATVLSKLLSESKDSQKQYQVVAVATQPGRPKGRNRQVQPSPVELLARSHGFDDDKILCPQRATEPHFLEALQSIAPDLCVTAAYGNYLPTKFLSIPKYGTLNIHPSLLPAFRGAAPVQRALEQGVDTTGVTVLYTVKEMDAGPILAQRSVPVPVDVQAPQLLHDLFVMGTDLLLENLPSVWSGTVTQATALAQNASAATHAAKVLKGEGELNFHQPALFCHNKVRAFAGWPATFYNFQIINDSNNINNNNEKDEEKTDLSTLTVELKILKTRVLAMEDEPLIPRPGTDCRDSEPPVIINCPDSRNRLLVRCGDGNILEVLEVQAPGRRAVAVKDYLNGLKGKRLSI